MVRAMGGEGQGPPWVGWCPRRPQPLLPVCTVHRRAGPDSGALPSSSVTASGRHWQETGGRKERKERCFSPSRPCSLPVEVLIVTAFL